MGKIDDMRRQREAQHRQRSGAAPAPAAPAPAAAATDDDADAETEADAEPAALDLEATSGTCSVCRKTKPMARGLISPHQKGLGKACAGSRKPPA